MRISLIPEELRLTPKALEGRPDAPVFVCRPLTAAEYVRLVAWLSAEEDRILADLYVKLFRERVARVENLEVDDGTPYNHEAHRDGLPASWQLEIGRRVWEAATLTEADQGKSSLPSDSETETPTPDARESGARSRRTGSRSR